MIYAVKYNPEVNRTQVLGDQEITQSELPIPEVLCRELVSLLKDLPSSLGLGRAKHMDIINTKFMLLFLLVV